MTDEKKIEYLLQYLDSLDDLYKNDFKCSSEINAAIGEIEELLGIKKPLSINVDVKLDVDETIKTLSKHEKVINNQGAKHLLDNVKTKK